jgi:hypothetical protein
LGWLQRVVKPLTQKENVRLANHSSLLNHNVIRVPRANFKPTQACDAARARARISMLAFIQLIAGPLRLAPHRLRVASPKEIAVVRSSG